MLVSPPDQECFVRIRDKVVSTFAGDTSESPGLFDRFLAGWCRGPGFSRSAFFLDLQLFNVTPLMSSVPL